MHCLKLLPLILYISGYIIVTQGRNTKLGNTPQDHGTRIVGGQRVQKREDFAYQASLRFISNNALLCGASIIDENHCLTAAHCCFFDRDIIAASLLRIVAGDVDQSRATNMTIRRDVTNIFTHPQYDRSVVINDIAIIRVDRSFAPWTPYVQPIALASKLPRVSTKCVVSGWGRIHESNAEVSSILYSASLPILPDEDCKRAYPNNMKRGMFCAGFMEGQRDACQGDSGGPLVCNRLLTGIVSWGEGCGRIDKPGVYTDISVYTNWINIQKERSGVAGFNGGFSLQLTMATFVFLYAINKNVT